MTGHPFVPVPATGARPALAPYAAKVSPAGMQSTTKLSCSGGRLVVVVGVFWLRTETVNVTVWPPTTTPGLSLVLRIDGFGWRTLTV